MEMGVWPESARIDRANHMLTVTMVMEHQHVSTVATR
jgi:hypothetical protein